MPLLRIAEIKTESISDQLHAIWVTIENQRAISTRTAQDRAHHLCAPDIVSLTGPKLTVLSAGKVQNPYFKKVNAVKRNPHQIKLDQIAGHSLARVRFIVSGTGPYTLTVDSVKGGKQQKSGKLQP